MRGKVRKLFKICPRFRITPAYAGKSLGFGLFPNLCKDHPRLCGEKCCNPITIFFTLGSPPPMRGKGTHLSKKSGVVRITPAYAGKSPQHLADKVANMDHPRLCGEKRGSIVSGSGGTGSPMSLT